MVTKMIKYTERELDEALQTVMATIANCEKIQPKFVEGTSQHTLLKNRIHALKVSKRLMENLKTTGNFTSDECVSQEEKQMALPPILSIIHKCKRARDNALEGTANYNRLTKTINAMIIAETLLNQHK